VDYAGTVLLDSLHLKNATIIHYCTVPLLLDLIAHTSVADPGCFIPDPDPTIAPSWIPDPEGKKAPDPGSDLFLYKGN
jgi:hypothetical protein